MKHSAYTQYFRDIASSHVDIAHGSSEKYVSFFRLVLSAAPFALLEITEFINGQKSKINPAKQFMLLESYDARLTDNRAGDKRKYFDGTFFILDKANNNNFNEVETILDQTEATAEQIAARMLKDFESQCNALLDEQFDFEKVGPIGSGPYFGTKVHFSFNRNSDILTYDENKWQ
jgi:hypothetical protein